MRPYVSLLTSLLFLIAGCRPDLGACDEALARTPVHSADAEGLPAYAGQALVDASCGNGAFCHSEYATGAARYGVPLGLDFDMAIATDADESDILRRGQREVVADRFAIYREVLKGHMPPGGVGADVVEAGRSFTGLPPIESDEGRRILRNWLACGAPVVQGTAPIPDVDAFGDFLDAEPTVACGTGLVSCNSLCVDLEADELNCGACDNACGADTVCYAGECIAGGCPAPTSTCGGSCVDTSADPSHCGTCDHACLDGASCESGTCACAGGTTLCDTTCVDLATSTTHCGSCGTACASGELCQNGACQGVSFADDIQPIFTASCTGSVCHTGKRPAASLSLAAGSAYANLVDQPSSECDGLVRVSPGSVSGSYLMNKLTGIGMCRGNQMPKTGTSLSAAELDAIRSWIAAGAPNN